MGTFVAVVLKCVPSLEPEIVILEILATKCYLGMFPWWTKTKVLNSNCIASWKALFSSLEHEVD